MEEKKKAPADAGKGTQKPAKKQKDNNTERENISFKEETETALDNLLNYEFNGGKDKKERERLYSLLSDDEKEKYEKAVKELKESANNLADLIHAVTGLNENLKQLTKKIIMPAGSSLSNTLSNIHSGQLSKIFSSLLDSLEPVSEWEKEKKAVLPYLENELKKEEYNGATPDNVFAYFNFVGTFWPDILKTSENEEFREAAKTVPAEFLKENKITPELARQAWENAKKAKEKADRTKLQRKYNSTTEAYTGPYLATYHSQVTDNFLLLEKKNAQQTRQQEIADKAVIQTPAGDYRMEISNFSKIKGLSINTHKLFSIGLAGLTAQNNYTHSGKTGGLKLRVNIPLNSYMNRVYPSTIFNKDAADIDKEKNRVENAVKKARRNIRTDINFWRDSRIEWEETIKGKPYKSSGFINILGAGKINKDYIQLEFTQSIAEYLLQLPINQYATWLLSIDSKKPNAYRIGLKLVQHANMDNNMIKGTADRLKVTTILKTTKLPSYEDLQSGKEDISRKWEERIKEPLETALDELQAAGGVNDWQYVKPGGIPLTDEEAENITDYETWANLLIEFSLSNQPDHTERLNRRKEEKAKAAKKTKKAKKKDV